MTRHRRPRGRVPNDVHPDNTSDRDKKDDSDNKKDDSDTPDTADTPDTFNPGEALQSLHLEVVDLEALANAANEAVVQLPYPSDREARRPFDRVYALVGKLADETSRVANRGGEMMYALTAHLKRKRADA